MIELLRFIEVEHERLSKYYDSHIDKDKHILARTVKLNEEVGELCEEVLFHTSLQRGQKVAEHKEHLNEEFADVVITALLLAKAMNVDVEKALEIKIKKINARYK